MRNVIDICLKDEDYYEKFSMFTRLKDSFKTKLYNECVINELNTKISFVKIPANINKLAYEHNVANAVNKFKLNNSIISINGRRDYDSRFLSKEQKRYLAFSIVESIRLILLRKQKSIRNANILVDDGAKKENRYIIEELAKEARNIIISTKLVNKVDKLREYIISNYGTTIQIVNNINDFRNIDFIISSERRNYNNSNVWYLDNFYNPKEDGLFVNKVTFKVPWESCINEYSPELLGAILKTKGKQSIKEILIENDIIIEQISFNSKDIAI